MSAPGFWDNQDAAAKVSADHARTARRLEEFRSLDRRGRGPRQPRRDGAGGSRDRRRARGPARADRGAPRDARGAAAVLRALRHRRRARHRQRRRRRHRRPGLGRDGAADADEVGREARLRRRAARGQPGGGGRHQVGDVPRRGRERLRALRRREGRAPARAAVAVRLRQPPPDVVRGRRGRAGHRGRRRGRDRLRRPAGRHVPRVGRGRPARQQDRLRGADHAPPERDRRAVPERALADAEPRDRDEDAALQARRARGAASAWRRSPRRRARRRT